MSYAAAAGAATEKKKARQNTKLHHPFCLHACVLVSSGMSTTTQRLRNPSCTLSLYRHRTAPCLLYSGLKIPHRLTSRHYSHPRMHRSQKDRHADRNCAAIVVSPGCAAVRRCIASVQSVESGGERRRSERVYAFTAATARRWPGGTGRRRRRDRRQ